MRCANSVAGFARRKRNVLTDERFLRAWGIKSHCTLELCRFPSEQNKTHRKRIRNQTRKIVAGAMRMETNQELNNLYQNSNSVFYFLKRMKKEGA